MFLTYKVEAINRPQRIIPPYASVGNGRQHTQMDTKKKTPPDRQDQESARAALLGMNKSLVAST